MGGRGASAGSAESFLSDLFREVGRSGRFTPNADDIASVRRLIRNGQIYENLRNDILHPDSDVIVITRRAERELQNVSRDLVSRISVQTERSQRDVDEYNFLKQYTRLDKRLRMNRGEVSNIQEERSVVSRNYAIKYTYSNRARTGVDQAYNELRGLYPERYPQFNTQGEMLAHINARYVSLRDAAGTVSYRAYYGNEAADDLANEIRNNIIATRLDYQDRRRRRR